MPGDQPAISEDIFLNLKKTPAAIIKTIPKEEINRLPKLNKDRLKFRFNIGSTKLSHLKRPEYSIVENKWYNKSYANLDEVLDEAKGENFKTTMQIISGIAKKAYDRYHYSLTIEEISIQDVLDSQKKYTSANISKVLSQISDNIGYDTFIGYVPNRRTSLPLAVPLIRNPDNKEWTIINGERIINLNTESIEDSIEQWAYYSAQLPWINEFYNKDGKCVYISINNFGNQIRPSNMNFPKTETSIPFLSMDIGNLETSFSYFHNNLGIQAGGIKGFGALDWSPYIKIASYKSLSDESSIIHKYLNPSYFRGGGALFYFRQEEQEGDDRSELAIMVELGINYPVKLSDEYFFILGLDYMNNWMGYYNIIANKFKTESVSLGFMGGILGVRKLFLYDSFSLSVTPYMDLRYTIFNIEKAFPFLYAVYGLDCKFLIPMENKLLFFYTDLKTSISNEHLYYEAKNGIEYKDDILKAYLKVEYNEKFLFDYSTRKLGIYFGKYFKIPIKVNINGFARIDREQYGLSLGLQFEDI